MARRIANLSGLLLVFIGLAGTAHAQESGEATRNVSFRAYRIGQGNWSDIRFEAAKGEIDTLNPSTFMKGRMHNYEGPAQLIFFREVPDPIPQDPARVARKPVARAVLPANMEEAILLFSPATGQTTAEFTVLVIDADKARFPSDSIRIFNATGVRLAGSVGGENLYFEPGISKAFNFGSFKSEGIPAAFLVETDDGPKFVFEKNLSYAAGRRVILVLQPPKRKGSYKIQATNLIEVMDEE